MFPRQVNAGICLKSLFFGQKAVFFQHGQVCCTGFVMNVGRNVSQFVSLVLLPAFCLFQRLPELTAR